MDGEGDDEWWDDPPDPDVLDRVGRAFTRISGGETESGVEVLGGAPLNCGCFCHLAGHQVHLGVEGAGRCCPCQQTSHRIRTVWPPVGQGPEHEAPSLPPVPITAEAAELFRKRPGV